MKTRPLPATTVWLCLLLTTLGAPIEAKEKIVVDAKLGRVTLPATAGKRARNPKTSAGSLLVLAAKDGNSKGALFVSAASAAEIEKALGKSGVEAKDSLRVFVEVDTSKDRRISVAPRLSIESLYRTSGSGDSKSSSPRALVPATWKRDVPGLPAKSIISIAPEEPALVSRTLSKGLSLTPNPERLPKAGSRVKIVIEKIPARVATGTTRTHLFISGKVQGVGFRNFTRRSTRGTKLRGWVMNLDDGRVEAIIEGPHEELEDLVRRVHRGPRSARVTRLERRDESPSGEFTSFDVRFLERDR